MVLVKHLIMQQMVIEGFPRRIFVSERLYN